VPERTNKTLNNNIIEMAKTQLELVKNGIAGLFATRYGIDYTNGLIEHNCDNEINSGVLRLTSSSGSTLVQIKDASDNYTDLIDKEITIQDVDNLERHIIDSVNDFGGGIVDITLKTMLANTFLLDVTNTYRSLNDGNLSIGDIKYGMSYNGVSSKSIGEVVDNPFLANTIYVEFETRNNFVAGDINRENLYSSNDNDGIVLGLAATIIPNSVITLQNNTINSNYAISNITLETGLHKLIFRWNGINYVGYLDGVEHILEVIGDIKELIINKVALGLREGGISGEFRIFDGVINNFIISSALLSQQDALDITQGLIGAETILNNSNSEVIYDIFLDEDNITNEGSRASEFDLVSDNTNLVKSGDQQSVPAITYDIRKEIFANKSNEIDFLIEDILYRHTNNDDNDTHITIEKSVSITSGGFDENFIDMELVEEEGFIDNGLFSKRHRLSSPSKESDIVVRTNVIHNSIRSNLVFNGTTSKALGISETNFNAFVVYVEFQNNNNKIPNDSLTENLFSANDDDGIALGDIIAALPNEVINLQNNTDGVNFSIVGIFLTPTLHKLLFRWNGETYVAYLDGQEFQTETIPGVPSILTIDKMALGFREGQNARFFDGNISDLVLSSNTITSQQALDITSGKVKRDTILDNSNSEVIYTTFTDVNNITNEGSFVGEYDLTGTALSLLTVPSVKIDLKQEIGGIE